MSMMMTMVMMMMMIVVMTPLLVRRDVEYDAWDLTSGAGGVCPKPHFVPPLPLECTLCVLHESLQMDEKESTAFCPIYDRACEGSCPIA